MRRGNFLEGLQAGFQSYMKTRQWKQGMERGELETERAKMQNRLLDLQVGDEYDPMRRFKREAPVRAAGFQEQLGQLPQVADVQRGIKTKDTTADADTEMDIWRRTHGERDQAKLDLLAKELGIKSKAEYDQLMRYLGQGVDAYGRPLRGDKNVLQLKDAHKMAAEAIGGDAPAASPIFSRVVSAYQAGDIQEANAVIRLYKITNTEEMEKQLVWLQRISPEQDDVLENEAIKALKAGASDEWVAGFYKEAKEELIKQGVLPKPFNMSKWLDLGGNLNAVMPPRPTVYSGTSKKPYKAKKAEKTETEKKKAESKKPEPIEYEYFPGGRRAKRSGGDWADRLGRKLTPKTISKEEIERRKRATGL